MTCSTDQLIPIWMTAIPPEVEGGPIRSVYIGYLMFSGMNWYSRVHINGLCNTKTCRLTLEGFGRRGLIISIIRSNGFIIGELVRMNSGRSIIEISGQSGNIGSLAPDSPMEMRDQAVKLASSKWIAAQKAATT